MCVCVILSLSLCVATPPPRYFSYAFCFLLSFLSGFHVFFLHLWWVDVETNPEQKRAEKLAIAKTKEEVKAAQEAAESREREERLRAKPAADTAQVHPVTVKKKSKKRSSTGSASSGLQDPGIIVVNPGPKAASKPPTQESGQ